MAEASDPTAGMSDAEIDAALIALGPLGVWAVNWIAKKEHALRLAQDQAMHNGAKVQRLRQELEAYKAHPPLLVDGETGKVTPVFDAASMLIEIDRLRGVLEKIAANDHMTSPSPVGAAHSAGVSFGLEWNAKLAREALRGAQ